MSSAMESYASAACIWRKEVGMHSKAAERTKVACKADSFFKSSEPRFAIARVDSVKS